MNDSSAREQELIGNESLFRVYLPPNVMNVLRLKDYCKS